MEPKNRSGGARASNSPNSQPQASPKAGQRSSNCFRFPRGYSSRSSRQISPQTYILSNSQNHKHTPRPQAFKNQGPTRFLLGGFLVITPRVAPKALRPQLPPDLALHALLEGTQVGALRAAALPAEGFGAQGLGFRAKGLGLMASGLGFRV